MGGNMVADPQLCGQLEGLLVDPPREHRLSVRLLPEETVEVQAVIVQAHAKAVEILDVGAVLVGA
ncbi:hypothetical protein D3C78_1241300 [compost metagenome]